MANLRNEMQDLLRQDEHYDEILKRFDIGLDDLTEECATKLELYAALQAETGLHSLRLNALKQYFAEIKQQNIECKLIRNAMTRRMEAQQHEIQELEQEMQLLDKFCNDASQQLKTNNTAAAILQIDKDTKYILERQRLRKLPENISMMELFKKCELAENLTNKKK